MKGKLAAVAVALLLVGTGAAVAMPGNAPDSAQADEHAQANDDPSANETAGEESASENASDDERRGPPADVPANGAENASGQGDAASASGQGPTVDLPAQVPDFVGDVHDAVRDHVSGALSGVDLGERIRSLTPDGASAVGNAPVDPPGGGSAQSGP